MKRKESPPKKKGKHNLGDKKSKSNPSNKGSSLQKTKAPQDTSASKLSKNNQGSGKFKNESSDGFSYSEQILESIAQGAFTVNIDLEITSFNRSAEIITGYSRWLMQVSWDTTLSVC